MAGSADTVRLTTFSHGAGCACKLGPSDLRDLMSRLPVASLPPEVVVGSDTGDDAAVIRLPGEGGHCLVFTTDFFTPIVDDPYDWGRIGAANAFSDVYAMGGAPAWALNLVAWPVDDLPMEMLAAVLEGGAKVAAEAGAAIVGGHSITDPEPKYGMAVIGFVDEARLTRNSTVPPGAALFLTKPLGLGLVTTAIKRERASDDQVRVAVEVMATLNAAARDAMVEVGAEAATDVTGFGLLGHLHSMLRASGVAAEVDAGGPDLLPGTLELARAGVVAGGTRRNHRFLEPVVDWGDLTDEEQIVLADAQTSGGMLIATRDPDRLAEALTRRDVPARLVGRTAEGPPGTVRVTGRIRD
jgi:selenide, water dikinase